MEVVKKKDKSQGKSFLKMSKSKSPFGLNPQKSLTKNFFKQKTHTKNNLQIDDQSQQNNSKLNVSINNLEDYQDYDSNEISERLFHQYQDYL